MKPVAERDENRGLANLPPALKLAVGDQLRLKADEADLSLLSQVFVYNYVMLISNKKSLIKIQFCFR